MMNERKVLIEQMYLLKKKKLEISLIKCPIIMEGKTTDLDEQKHEVELQLQFSTENLEGVHKR